ncbi:MAG: hypothetical protein HOH33_03445 [Verrucomicrobia bacterium]|jgi:hypothetical protein|nr:hypothetical protein [Verrucomicrobiota bacterium]
MRIALYFFTVIFARHLNALVFGSLLLCTFGIPKLCANSIQWSSYVGSADTDSAEAVAVGADGSVYVVYSSGDEVSDVDFHWGTGITYVIAKFTSDGSQIEWKTGIGLDYTNPPTDDKGELVAGHPNQFGYGSIAGLSVDPGGNVVLAATIGG